VNKITIYRATKVPNDQSSKLPMFQTTKVPNHQNSELQIFQVAMRQVSQEPKNKILGTKSSEQKKPIFRFSCGKIDQKSDFWNIVLHCSEKEASCTFVITWLRHSMQRCLADCNASERSKTAVCRGQNSVRRTR